MKEPDFKIIESRLCETCSVLRFDEDEYGGFEGDDGVLHLPKELSKPYNDVMAKHYFDTDFYRRDILPTLPDLTASAEAGCSLCIVLRAATLALRISITVEIEYLIRYVWKPHHDRRRGLYLLVADIRVAEADREALGLDGYTLLFTLDAEEGPCREWLRLCPAPRENTLSEENIVMLKREIDDCAQNCTHSQPSGIPPTRLIDVGSDDADGIRLLETSSASMALPVRYAALSYCWGQKDVAKHQLKTTTDTYAAHLTGIPLASMPKVLQDTIATARALSIRYIWVDAICIIQGDANDWMRESQRMGSVYTNAYITICAISSSSCVDGFLDRSQPVRIQFNSAIHPNVQGIYNIRHQLEINPKARRECIYSRMELAIACGAWQSRGWTLQEEQMSIRKIAFGPSQLHFSCPLKHVSEPGIQEDLYLSNILTELEEYRTNQDHERLYTHWYSLMEQYSGRNLTVIEDTLPALSGLAQLIANETRDQYVAGLWSSDLLRGLLWSQAPVVRIEAFLQPPPETLYIGPSWSWLAHKTVKFRKFTVKPDYMEPGWGVRFRPECKYFEVWSSPEDSQLNPFGRIVDAGIRIEGKVAIPKTRKTSISGDGDYDLIFGAGAVARSCALDWVIEEAAAETMLQQSIMLLLASGIGDADGSLGFPDDQIGYSESDSSEFEINDSVLLAPEEPGTGLTPGEEYDRMNEERSKALPSERNAWGLLLYPKEGTDKYVRIGTFKCDNGDGGPRAFDACEYRRLEIV